MRRGIQRKVNCPCISLQVPNWPTLAAGTIQLPHAILAAGTAVLSWRSCWEVKENLKTEVADKDRLVGEREGGKGARKGESL